ncbi:hypothetical protein DPQ33_11365 [Oceanidesulfovibrio indonesiensis]|uniref:HTH merR-type domain-containing protein n=2 Tax=Oceanidesulfovibrio indonesiensis TaxID=54767 RepID=A0A7M3MDB2_9BACT|nr:hypothetical protein DPQ33_11365 [Oceanidesulfovibrio indonesiensis]
MDNAMPTPALTHKDIATELGIAEATVKSYRRAFPEFFDVRHTGKPLRFAASALDVCRIIRDGRKDALTASEIRDLIERTVPDAKGLWNTRAAGNHLPIDRAGQNREHPAGASGDLDRIEQALAHSEEMQRQLVQIHGESAARLGAMQHRMFEALTALQDRAERQNETILVMTERQVAILDKLESLAEQLEQVAEYSAIVAESPDSTSPSLAQNASADADRIRLRSSVANESRGSTPRVTHVAVRNAYGDIQRYTLATGESAEPPEPASAVEPSPGSLRPSEAGALAHEDPAPQPRLYGGPFPPRETMLLPLVVRSELGEYLGVGGKALGSFSLNDLIELVEESFPPPRSFHIRFEPEESAADSSSIWTLRLHQDSGPRYRLLLERTTTPRGNDVVVLVSLEVDGQDVPPANIYLFIKQMLQLQSQS